MKKIIPLILGCLYSMATMAQTATFTLTTPACHNDGVLTANFSGLTPPLTVSWHTFGLAASTIIHTGVSGMSDALTSYSGGPLYISATDGTGTATSFYSGAPPFLYTTSSTPAYCPALGTASVTVTGGTAPYTYSWYDDATLVVVGTTNPISVGPGNYGVTITDAAGCVYGSMSGMDSGAYVYSVASFSVAVTSTPASCTDGTATITPIIGGTAPYTYLWSNGATTSSLTGLTRGSYNVVVTDALGCSATGYVYISQSPVISAPVTPTPATCLASDGGVIAFGSGGMPPYTYLWSNGATTQSQSGLPAAYYSVVVTDANGCSGDGGGNVSVSTPITATYSATASLCTSPTGTATLALAGGTAPYTVSWYTTPPQTGVAATALPAGNHHFHVVDAVGCIRDGAATVPPIHIISAMNSATAAHCTTASGGLTAFPSGGTTPYTYLWSTGATTANISSVVGGWYNVTITDAAGCHVSKMWEVPISSPVSLGLSSTAASCIFASDGSITASALGGTLPYTYTWSNGGTSSSISSLHSGWYYLHVSDATGCTAYNQTNLAYNPAGTSCYCTIDGTVYHDINGNCIQDVGEPGIEHIQIYCSGIGYTYTDASGYYSFKVPTGSYTISQTVLSFYPLAACQLNNIPVSVVAGTGCVHTIDFANAINPIHDVHVSRWDYNWPVPGNTYTQVSVITNDGTVTEAAAQAGYKPDGQLFSPSFTPSTVYTGLPYYYHNATTFPSLTPGAHQTTYATYYVPTAIPLGTSVLFKDTVAYATPMSNWLTDYSPWNNVDYFTTTVVSSYDPNFKEVSPKGKGTNGLIYAKDSVLEYMVHFQNTGTAPAEKVEVIDTLDNNLNWTSLRPVYQSAKGTVTLTQSGTYKIAKFAFDAINLPPASQEPMTSNGLFTYTIHTKPGLPIGTTFKNKASIYFDYNAPIVTNTTLNTLGSTTGVEELNPALTSANGFSVYPNPANQSFSAIINADANGNGSISVSDVTGKELIVKSIAIQKGNQTVNCDVSGLTPGVYFVTMTNNGQNQTQKLVIMK